MATSNYSWNLPTVGGSEDAWGTQLNANWTALDTLLGGVSNTELAILDGATVSTAELNILDGVTATTAEFNVLDGITSTTAELNKLDGFIGTVAALNYAQDLLNTGVTAAEFDRLDGLTATAVELNKLDGATVTTAEINYLDGVTSNVQTQIDAKPAATVTISAGNGLTGGGDLSANRTISHADTSSQASVNNSGTTFIQDITLDTYGHVTGIGSATIPQGIGDGQTWQGVSRSPGTTYQNTTGKPIAVSSTHNVQGTYTMQVSTNGSSWVTLSRSTDNDFGNPFFGIVPNGHYYRVGAFRYEISELR